MTDNDTESVELTLKEIRGLRAGLIWGLPDPTPLEITTALTKLGVAEQHLIKRGING